MQRRIQEMASHRRELQNRSQFSRISLEWLSKPSCSVGGTFPDIPLCGDQTRCILFIFSELVNSVQIQYKTESRKWTIRHGRIGRSVAVRGVEGAGYSSQDVRPAWKSRPITLLECFFFERCLSQMPLPPAVA